MSWSPSLSAIGTRLELPLGIWLQSSHRGRCLSTVAMQRVWGVSSNVALTCMWPLSCILYSTMSHFETEFIEYMQHVGCSCVHTSCCLHDCTWSCKFVAMKPCIMLFMDGLPWLSIVLSSVYCSSLIRQPGKRPCAHTSSLLGVVPYTQAVVPDDYFQMSCMAKVCPHGCLAYVATGVCAIGKGL